MRLSLPDRGECKERGAIAVMTALLMVVFLAVAALGVDITTQVNQRQKLHDTLDAAAHAGAYRLPNPGPTAESDARANALKNDPTLSLPTTPVNAVTFFCVVAASSWNATTKTGVVDSAQIPGVCNPASAGSAYTGFKCSSNMICSIPCKPSSGDTCNTVRVTGEKPVPFSFAPAIGINQGGTGAVTSVACKGSCGTIPPNPMDVAVVADRTSSMLDADVIKMRDGISGMFQKMTPSQQYVSLGTIGRSKLGAAPTCLSLPWDDSYPAQKGPWMPVPFSNDYLLPGTTTLNPSSTLVQGVNCLTNKSSTGTYLASPMKSAARYLLGAPTYDANNLGLLPARTGTIRKAIIFETDGVPNESTVAGSTALNISGDIGSSAGATACSNFAEVATNAKNATPPIMVVTVAYNIKTTDLCGGGGTPRLDRTLAAAASEKSPGVASEANIDCSGTTQAAKDRRAAENADGDYFFCAASGTDMTAIFKTALGQLAKGIRLIQLP